MLSNLLFSVNAILPIIILVGIGYFLKKIGFLKDEFYSFSSKFVFHIVLPILLFKNLYDSEIKDINYKFLIFIALSITSLFIIASLIALIATKDKTKRGVLIQGISRSNYAFIGIPLASSMFESAELISKATLSASIASLVCIPLFNIYSVIVLCVFNENNETNKKELVKKTLLNVLKNPLINAIFMGLILLLIRYFIPSVSFFVKDKISFVYKSMTYLSNISTPLALIVVGGQFDFSNLNGNKKLIIIQVIMKTMIVPLIFLVVAIMIHFEAYEYAVLISIFGSPVAVASAIMAKEMKSDYNLASSMVVYSTIASSITLFLIIFILRTIGVL